MTTIQGHVVSEREGTVAVLRLARGTANPLDLDLLEQLSASLAAARRDAAIRGLVPRSLPRKACGRSQVC